jgi:RNA polymerase sigma-32 factor
MAQLHSDEGSEQSDLQLSGAQVGRVAQILDVKSEDVREMEFRLSGAELALDPMTDSDGEEKFSPMYYLADESQEPTQVIARHEREVQLSDGLKKAMNVLDDRSRHIVQARWLDVDENGKGRKTLQELAAEYCVSLERIRQIEVNAFKKMRLCFDS